MENNCYCRIMYILFKLKQEILFMSRLTEKYVQDVSISFLHDHYKSKYSLESIYAKKEVKTIYKKINGRADGLIAFKLQDGNIFTVSLEARVLTA